MKKTYPKPKDAKAFDRFFEDHDIGDLLEVKPKRVNVDFPPAILRRVDLKAKELGLSRQALIKYWVAEKLDLVSA